MSTAVRLSHSNASTHISSSHPIHASIDKLDHEAMALLTIPPTSGGEEAHERFADYLARTKNTICGRHPIGVLLGSLAEIETNGDSYGREEGVKLKWVRYEQSSKCFDVSESSVSYASAYVVF